MNRLWSILVLAALAALPLAAEDQVDNLFDDPPPDTVADPQVKLTQDQLSLQKVRFFESVKADGFYIAGWVPGSGAIKQSPYNALNFSFGTDARLDKNIRTYASFFITYPTSDTANGNLYNPYKDLIPKQNDLSFSSLKLKEIFLDYTLGDAVFLRVGRENVTWGQGRIFNPANFVGALNSGVGIRATTTILGNNVSLVAMKNDSYFNLSSSWTDLTGLDTLGLAAKVEGSWLLVSGGVSAFHHGNVGNKGEAYLKTSLAGFDLFGEGIVEQRSVKGKVDGSPVPSVLGGVYREFGTGSPWLQLQFEYLATGRSNGSDVTVVPRVSHGWDDQSVGLGATSDAFGFLKTKPSVSWLHSLHDRSGQLLVGFTNTSFPHMDLSAGVVWIYGATTGRYVLDNPDPLKRQLMLTLKATFQFNIDN